ncbi:NTP transferase domain-containing protein [Oryzobacter sp. R7]|uniref:nucleotidyltransferase family protein n=1 Tax=Oryzobacter faecalis TaxID=3388656 RepID=UPI00398D22AB
MTVVALVLAAGAGRRMGGPKALVRPRPGAPTLLEAAVGRVRAAGCDEVVVVVGAEASAAGDVARATGARVVEATGWDEGMGASLRAGLDALTSGAEDAEVALVTLVDLPDVGPDVLARVLDAADGPATLARATYAGTPGHPVLLGRHHWAPVRDSATGDRGAREYLRVTDHRLVECGDLATGRDVDTVDDLRRSDAADA